MKTKPDDVVISWLDQRPPESVWTTAVTVFEIRFGLNLLAKGRKRSRLEAAWERALAEDFAGRILSFDEPASSAAAKIASRRHRAGRAVDVRDTLIAGIATARRADLATGNTRHFQDLDVTVVDPWSAP